jgi:acyl carrier protein
MDIVELNKVDCTMESQLRRALLMFSGDDTLENVDRHARLSEVLDSLGHFTFLLSLEEEFNIDIPDEKFSFASMGTLDGVLQVLHECYRDHATKNSEAGVISSLPLSGRG